MIKLKSLFRRGQGTSSSASSSAPQKHQQQQQQQQRQQHSNNNRQKSQSTTSLNTAHEQQNNAAEQQQKQQQQITTKLYPSLTSQHNSYERGVDVGNDDDPLNDKHKGQTQQQQSGRTPPAQRVIKNSTSTVVSSNTLPHKKSKFKGHKQPKQLPTAESVPPDTTYDNVTDCVQKLMTSIAAVSKTNTNSVAVANSNYNNALAAAVAPGAGAAAGSDVSGGGGVVPTTGGALDCNDVYQLNQIAFPAASAATVAVTAAAVQQQQQFINQEQQLRQQQQQQQQLQHQQLIEAENKMQELQTQLECLERENRLLESRITDLLSVQNEVTKLKNDLLKMQSVQDKSQLEIGNLKYENESLRNRLRDVVNSPLSDAEKHQIIQDSQRLHSSAPASIALPSTNEAHDVSGTSCLTPDWDKHSSSSEISVACLQDKIIQMEETHYSTNEELQATLQELADLQSQLSDTQTENERLAEEKDVLFQSLCRQTEKLNESRTQISTLQELLLRDTKQAELNSSEREKKLLDLIKTSQEEREAVLVKQEELNAELQELRQNIDISQQENQRQRERIALLDSTLDAANAERKQTESQLLQAKEEISQRIIEINRLSTLLENARSKIDELEADLARGEKADLSDVLDAARKEKDALEERVAELQDQCERGQAEIRRLKDQISGLTEECKVAKNNAKCAVSHLEYRLDQLQQEKDKLAGDYQQLNESVNELNVQCKCHQEDKTQLQNLLTETQRHLGDVELKLNETKVLLEKETKLRKQEADEWQQFQADLLMTVRVANDFKTEALSAREQLMLDNKTQKEKIRLLEQQLDKLTKQQLQQTETQQSVLSTVQQEMASRRNKIGNFNRQDSRLSVKTLIETIENNKQSKQDEVGTTESHYSSNSSLNSGAPDTISPVILPVSNDWHENLRLPVIGGNGGNSCGVGVGVTTTTEKDATANTICPNNTANIPNTRGALREEQQQQQQQPPQQAQMQQQQQQQQQHQTSTTPTQSTLLNSINFGSKTLLSGERKDPLNMLAKNGGSKRNALLKWCQNKTVGYRNIDITNFSSSWNDGLAFCAILHSYLPDRIPYDTLSPANKRRNFSLAFAAAEFVGIPTTLNINDMCQLERPDWTQVMSYVTAIYKHFET